MVEERRETVIVDGDRAPRSNPIGWVIAVVIIVILLALFFLKGGFGMFGNSGDSVNVDTPDTVNVQPTNGQ